MFAALINYVLQNLDDKWKAEGLGFWLHKSGNFYAWQELYDELIEANPDNCKGFDYQNLFVSCLTYLDDCYLLAKSMYECQRMLNDVVTDLNALGFHLMPQNAHGSLTNIPCHTMVDMILVSRWLEIALFYKVII